MYKMYKLILAFLVVCLCLSCAVAQDMSEEFPLIPLDIFHNRPELPRYESPSLRKFRGVDSLAHLISTRSHLIISIFLEQKAPIGIKEHVETAGFGDQWDAWKSCITKIYITD